MSCVLRVSGDFDSRLFLAHSPWQPEAAWRRGEIGIRTRVERDSGFNVLVSEAGFDAFSTQTRDAVAFLTRYESEFARLGEGAVVVLLDFSVEQQPELAARSLQFPLDLIVLAGKCGVSIQLTLYAVSSE
jgi:hypothetical protein